MSLRQTAFHSRTAALGATFVEYAGYDFPSQFAEDVTDEYWACRQRAVVMDLTPLRKIEVTGPGAESVLQATVTRDLKRLADGQVVYTGLCDDDGNLLDDGTVFRFGAERFRWIGYLDEDEDWFRKHAARLGLEVSLENSTDHVHNIAVQGPASREIINAAVSTPEGRPAVSDLTWFRFTECRVGGPDGPAALVSRTGYSGELGYELWCHPDDGPAVWDAVWTAGQPHGLAPLGLDALDIVRIDAGLIFKGYEYDGSEDPFEAGIGFVVTKGKEDDFVGKQALARRREHPTQALVGLEIEGADAIASGVVAAAGEEVGVITSGAFSPVLDKSLALARVRIGHAGLGGKLEVSAADSDAAPVGATVVRFPFYDPDKTRPRS